MLRAAIHSTFPHATKVQVRPGTYSGSEPDSLGDPFGNSASSSSDLSTGCKKFFVQTLRDTESRSPQRVHFGAKRREKSYTSGSQQQSEHTCNPESQTLCLPAGLAVVQQEPVGAKVQGQVNRFRLATSQPRFLDMRNRGFRC